MEEEQNANIVSSEETTQQIQMVQKSVAPGLGCGIPSLILAFFSFSFFISHLIFPKIAQMVEAFYKDKYNRPGYIVTVDMSISYKLASFFKPIGIILGITSIALGIVGIILYITKKPQGTNKNPVGLILSIIGLVFGIGATFLCFILSPMVVA